MARTNGRKVYNHMMEIKNGVDSKLSEISRKVSAASSGITNSQTKMSQLLGKMSQDRVKDLLKDKNGLLNSQEQTVLDLITTRRATSVVSINNKIEDLNATEKRLSKNNRDLQVKIDEIEGGLLYVESQVRDILSKDENFLIEVDRHSNLQISLKDLEKTVKKVNEETPLKVDVFQSDELFNYLLNIGFGTNDYRGGFLTKGLDRMLANFIGFDDNFRNYNLLKSLPNFYNKKFQELKVIYKESTEKLDAMHAKESSKHGLSQMVKEKDRLKENRNILVEEIKGNHKELNKQLSLLDAYQNNQDDEYKEASELLTRFLTSLSLSSLGEFVNQTKSPKDNEIFKELVGHKSTIEQSEKELRQFRGQQAKLKIESDEIDDVVEKFKRKGLNSSNYSYDSSVLDNISLTDVMVAGLWWDSLKSDYRDDTPPPPSKNYDSYSNSSSSSSSSDWSSSSSSSSSWSSGGDIGGSSGSFSSGDSF